MTKTSVSSHSRTRHCGCQRSDNLWAPLAGRVITGSAQGGGWCPKLLRAWSFFIAGSDGRRALISPPVAVFQQRASGRDTGPLWRRAVDLESRELRGVHFSHGPLEGGRPEKSISMIFLTPDFSDAPAVVDSMMDSIAAIGIALDMNFFIDRLPVLHLAVADAH